MYVESKNELEEIMKSPLCNRCGTCVGLSEKAIVFKDKEGAYQPEFVEKIKSKNLERILKSCSGKYFDFKYFNKLVFPKASNYHVYLGSYESISIGFSKEKIIRSKGASGGIISSVLIYLLQNKIIDGAIVLKMSEDKPWLSEPFIAKSSEEILIAAQSKYTISSVNEILEVSKSFNGRLAFVGIPPQVQAIRKLQQINDKSVNNIDYIFGPFYGNTLHFSSIISFLKSHRINDYKTITKLHFRHGEWPGNMRAETNLGEVAELKKFHANYLIPFHILKNSLYCTDLTNEFTDISGGDAWSPVYEDRGKGYSMIIARSKKGQELIKKMKLEGRLSFEKITQEEALSMHSHGYDLKKRGTFIRIKLRKFFGKPIPNYGYSISGFGFKRYLMEFIIILLFFILSKPLSRRIAELIPPHIIGNIFEKARTIWKNKTHSIKRDKL